MDSARCILTYRVLSWGGLIKAARRSLLWRWRDDDDCFAECDEVVITTSVQRTRWSRLSSSSISTNEQKPTEWLPVSVAPPTTLGGHCEPCTINTRHSCFANNALQHRWNSCDRQAASMNGINSENIKMWYFVPSSFALAATPNRVELYQNGNIKSTIYCYKRQN